MRGVRCQLDRDPDRGDCLGSSGRQFGGYSLGSLDKTRLVGLRAWQQEPNAG